MRALKEHRYFAIFYGALYTLFLWPLMLFQKTFVFGDYWQQHYPWAMEYARGIREGKMPYWVTGMAAGFPLAAEGQVGAYYVPHIVFYGLFPFETAYTLLILAHVLVGGIGFYRYAEKIGLSRQAASLAAVLFSFSSAYGGCFSNTASLKVLAWLPWAMLLPEYLNAAKGKDKVLWISLLGALFGLMWTAGAPQMALYAIGYLGLYWLLKFRFQGLPELIAANAIGFILSLPQWAATLELIPESVRAGESTAFTLFGSFFPPAAVSLFFPSWGIFLGFSFYIGAAAWLLILSGFVSKKTSIEKVHWWLVFIFFVLAAGKYSPVYSFLSERFSQGLVRYPYKLAFFCTVSMAVPASFALDRLTADRSASVLKAKKMILAGAFIAVLAAPALAQTSLRVFKGQILNFAEKAAVETYEGKKEPLSSKEGYVERAFGVYDNAKNVVAYSDPWTLAAAGFFLCSAAVMAMALRPAAPEFWSRMVLPAVLAADLLVFGQFLGTGFTGNAAKIPEKLPQGVQQALYRRQQTDGSVMIEWSRNAAEELPPNSSLAENIRHAGGYSPLLLKRYYELAKDLGIADSSLGRKPYDLDVWKKEMGIVQAFGVSQVLSSEKIELPGSRLADVFKQTRFEKGQRFENKRYLYEFEPVLPSVYTVYSWKALQSEEERLAYLKSPAFKPMEEAVVERRSEFLTPSDEYLFGAAEIVSETPRAVDVRVEMASDGVIVFRSAFYPRWKAEIDGRKVEIMPVNHAFSGIYASKGAHAVRFYYDESLHKIAEGLAAAACLILVFGNRFIRSRRR